MTGTTLEELLRQAEALALQALREAEARCAVLGQYVSDGESKGARTTAWSDAARELRALQDHRAELKRRHSLIQQALEHPAGESPTKVALPAQPRRTASRTQRQVQIRVRRRG
jgi:hypothetical protein